MELNIKKIGSYEYKVTNANIKINRKRTVKSFKLYVNSTSINIIFANKDNDDRLREIEIDYTQGTLSTEDINNFWENSERKDRESLANFRSSLMNLAIFAKNYSENTLKDRFSKR